MEDQDHGHEFYLTGTYQGRESGATFYRGECACGAVEAHAR